MDKLATLQQQLQEAEDKKVALQDQVRSVGEEQGIGYSSIAEPTGQIPFMYHGDPSAPFSGF